MSPEAGGLGCLRLHGQSYHRVLPGERAAGEECGLSYYMYDSSYEAARADPPALIDDLRRYLMTNNGHVRQVSPQAVCRCSEFLVLFRPNACGCRCATCSPVTATHSRFGSC